MIATAPMGPLQGSVMLGKHMKDLLEKLSSYNIFNYLLPGIIFVVLAEKYTTISLVQQDLVLGVFLYYFIGLVLSRIGSLFIEPVLQAVNFLKFANYSDFISASKEDAKIDLLSEANNMYRTFCSVFLFILIVKFYEYLLVKIPELSSWNDEIILMSLLLLFLFSYKKQTSYITKRISTKFSKDQ